MVKRYQDPEMWEKIVLLSVFGKSKLAISEELGNTVRDGMESVKTTMRKVHKEG